MRNLADVFSRLIRKAHRETRLAVIAIGAAKQPNGTIVGTYSLAGADAEHMEYAARCVLRLVLEHWTEPGTDCPCCTDRHRRFTAALAALQPDADAPTPTHLH